MLYEVHVGAAIFPVNYKAPMVNVISDTVLLSAQVGKRQNVSQSLRMIPHTLPEFTNCSLLGE
jgi:hypothetical protein